MPLTNDGLWMRIQTHQQRNDNHSISFFSDLMITAVILESLNKFVSEFTTCLLGKEG
jgi:hypothetical protein